MLQIQNLTITMKKDLRDLVKNLRVSLTSGDRCAVIGEEGNGKSTLLKLIYDEDSVADYAEHTGSILKGGLTLGYLAQELLPEEMEQTVYEFCCLEPAFLDSSPRELADAAGKLKIPVDIFYSNRPLKTLSGGEKVKLRMALLMLKRADVLLLDEPSGDLDIETLEWMEHFINSYDSPVLYISHDETLLENTANVVLHMEQLRRKTLPRYTFSRTDYKTYCEERLSKFSTQTRLAKKEREEYEKQQERFRRISQKVEHSLRGISRQDPHGGRLLKKKMKAVKSLEKRFDRDKEDMTDFPDSEDAILIDFPPETEMAAGKTVLDFTLPLLEIGGETLSKDIRLYVKGAEHVCITGRNGAGKTTLLRKIAEDLLLRKDIRAAYMPQNYADLLDMEKTPVEFLTNDSGEKDVITRAKTYLGSMKYTADEFEHKLAALSGGQKAKLFFLKMILDGNNVLILDEPTRNFSPLSNPVIRDVLRKFSGTIISISHDRKYIEEVCDICYRLDGEGLHLLPEINTK